jgi:hypothetical protein
VKRSDDERMSAGQIYPTFDVLSHNLMQVGSPNCPKHSDISSLIHQDER